MYDSGGWLWHQRPGLDCVQHLRGISSCAIHSPSSLEDSTSQGPAGPRRLAEAGVPRAPAVRRAEGQQDCDRSCASPVCSPPSRLPAPCMSSTLPGLCPGRPSPGCPERPPDHAGTRGPPPHLPSQVNILLSTCVHVFHEIIQTSISNKKSPLTFYQNP